LNDYFFFSAPQLKRDPLGNGRAAEECDRMTGIWLRTSAFAAALFAIHSDMDAQVGPTQTLETAFAVAARRDWPALAMLVHPSALDSLRQESLGLIILMTENRLAGKKGGGYNPGEVVISEHLPRIGTERIPQFPNDPTIAHLAALSPTAFFVSWCAAVYRPASAESPVREVVGLQRRIIGAVPEGDTLAHVLYRRESRYIEMGELFIDLPGRVTEMPLKRADNRWLLLLNDDFGWTVDFMEALAPERPFPITDLKRTTRIARPSSVPSMPRDGARQQPLEVVNIAFSAFERGDWTALAATVHPDRLASFQREVLAYLVAWTSSRDAAAQAAHKGMAGFFLMYDDSLPPESVAEVADVKIPAFPDEPTIGELARLSPSQFFAGWCQATYGGESDKTSRSQVGTVRREMVGQVLEDDTLAHVLYRSGSHYRSAGQVQRMPVKRLGDGWGLLLNDDIGEITLFMLLLDHV
jgi:hypothetical protein